MRLSDAIALGRTLIKSQPGTVWDERDASGCAWGMAFAATGNHYCDNIGLKLLGWHWSRMKTVCMSCSCFQPDTTFLYVDNAIAHLFDKHVYEKCDWTLDQLIDWVRSVEPRGVGRCQRRNENRGTKGCGKSIVIFAMAAAGTKVAKCYRLLVMFVKVQEKSGQQAGKWLQ